MRNDISSLKKITWQQCREAVLKVNHKLGEIIDTLDPKEEMGFWLAKYPYGALIDNGQFHYPMEDGKLLLLNDPKLPKQLKLDFEYAGLETPAGVLLTNSIELFIESQDRIIPQALFMPGDIFALWGRLDPQPIFHPSPLMCGTAGARSIFMIPNISDLAFHKKLKHEFNVRQPPPKNLSDQWKIFTSIVNHSTEGKKWQTEALLFTGKWLHHIKNDKAFQPLYIYLLEQAWRSSAYWRNKVFYDFVFSCVQQNRNLKPNPYLVDTVKYLITIAIGAVPGFGVPSNNLGAPIDLIQRVYVECYNLKKYAPTIVHPLYFTQTNTPTPVYYSLQYPTTLEFSPRSRKPSNTLYDLTELKHILEVFLNEVKHKKLKIEQGIIGKVAEEVGFDFFHSKPDKYGEINSAKNMIINDPKLLNCFPGGETKQFADTGAFVRGCVRVSLNEKIKL